MPSVTCAPQRFYLSDQWRCIATEAFDKLKRGRKGCGEGGGGGDGEASAVSCHHLRCRMQLNMATVSVSCLWTSHSELHVLLPPADNLGAHLTGPEHLATHTSHQTHTRFFSLSTATELYVWKGGSMSYLLFWFDKTVWFSSWCKANLLRVCKKTDGNRLFAVTWLRCLVESWWRAGSEKQLRWVERKFCFVLA